MTNLFFKSYCQSEWLNLRSLVTAIAALPVLEYLAQKYLYHSLTLARACAAKGYCSRSGRSVGLSVNLLVCDFLRTFSLEP